MGKPTASEFERIITPKKWEPTKGETRRNYQIYLLTELILDMPLSGVSTAALQHGHEWEEKARAAYEMNVAGKEVEQCGFCTNDAGTYGASPDAFVGEEGSLEIKSPFKPEIHVAYMVDNDALVQEYFVQTQGQLFVTGRKWTDLISYFSGMPMVCVRCVPVVEFQDKLSVALHQFCAEFSDLVERCIAKGWLTERPPMTEWVSAGGVEMVRKLQGDFYITDEDIERIIGATTAHRGGKG
jgi:hypothetical protein